MLFTQDNLIIPLCEDSGVASGTGVELRSFNMALYDHACIILHFASTYTGSTAATLTVETGSAGSGDQADATFQYRWNSASSAILASSDVWAAVTSASSLSLEASASKAGYVLTVEIDAGNLPTASKTYNWVTVDIGSASLGTLDAYAILSKPRYAKAVMTGAIS